MEKQALDSLVFDFELGTPQRYRNLTIVPLRGEDGGPPSYFLLDEALKEGAVEVKEVGDGMVPVLLVANNAERDLLLISGEELLGAKQNRTINVTIMVPARSSLRIPVSCTERGRWRETECGARIAQTSNHYSSCRIRQTLIGSVGESLNITGTYHSNQVGIWDSISSSLSDMKIDSSTQAQKDLFEEKKEDIEDYLAHFSLTPDQLGQIGVINGDIKGLDLFGSKDTMGKMFERLLRSFIIEAIAASDESSDMKETEVKAFLDDFHKAKVKTLPAPGKGEHDIIEGGGQRGMALMVEGKLCHLFTAPWDQ